jgi:hypothetical protein
MPDGLQRWDTWHGLPRRLLDDRTQAVLCPLLYGRARVLVGPVDSLGADLAY